MAKKNSDGSINYVHNDHLGSSSVITNQVGALVESTSYDPWGKVNSGGTASKFQYTGQEKDSETGLNYYNARYYSSDIRRFTQPDTLISNIYNPQTLNRYSYVNNNPLRYTDPSGHEKKSFWDRARDAWDGMFGNKNKEKKQEYASTQQVQQMFGSSEVKISESNSENTNNYSSLSTVAVGGAVVGSANSYSVYVGKDAQGVIQYAGMTRQSLEARIAQHLRSLDPLRNKLFYEGVHSNLSRMVARGSEQIYQETYNLVENGANKIYGISRNNPIYQEAKNAAYAAGAVPGAIGASNSLLNLIKYPIIVTDYNSAAQYFVTPQQE